MSFKQPNILGKRWIFQNILSVCFVWVSWFWTRAKHQTSRRSILSLRIEVTIGFPKDAKRRREIKIEQDHKSTPISRRSFSRVHSNRICFCFFSSSFIVVVFIEIKVSRVRIVIVLRIVEDILKGLPTKERDPLQVSKVFSLEVSFRWWLIKRDCL